MGNIAGEAILHRFEAGAFQQRSIVLPVSLQEGGSLTASQRERSDEALRRLLASFVIAGAKHPAMTMPTRPLLCRVANLCAAAGQRILVELAVLHDGKEVVFIEEHGQILQGSPSSSNRSARYPGFTSPEFPSHAHDLAAPTSSLPTALLPERSLKT